MIAVQNHSVTAIERERDFLLMTAPVHAHRDSSQSGRFNVDVELLDGRDEHMATVGLASEHGREQPDHCCAADWRALMIPRAVARDPHSRMPAAFRIPLLDGRHPALIDKLLELGQAYPLKLD